MIVKIRTMDDGWLYFSVTKNIKVRILSEEQCKNGLQTNIPDWVEITPKYFEVGGKKLGVAVLNIEGTIVYTTETAYLLNNDGKTIEKLN